MEKLVPKFNFRNIFILFLLLTLLFGGKIFAQGTGALLMLKDNFHSNLLNPSYSRNDKAIIIALPGLAGASVGNSGNFKLTELVVKDNNGKMVMDLENFIYNSANKKVSLFDWSAVPLIYISVPFREGRFTLYLKEQVQSALNFDLKALEFFANGNVPVDFKSYNSDNINYTGIGYRELALGYSKPFNDRLDIGIRGKILFGSLYANVSNWSYGIYTAENDESVRLVNKGKGKLSVPIELILDDKLRIKDANTENALQKYIGTLQNPGIGLDFGATYQLDEKSWLSASLNDLGMIWFRDKAYKIEQNASYNYSGFDISNSIDSKRGENYINPGNLNFEIRDSIRHVFKPKVDSASFVQPFVPKLALHYNYNINEVFSFGASNQTSFYKNAVLNIFTVSALQKKGGFSVFENISAFGFNSLTFGAGLQYEGQYGQIFAVADNLYSVYYPAKNESYSFTFGMCLLLNKPKKNKSKKDKSNNFKRSGGETSPYLPFYEKKK